MNEPPKQPHGIGWYAVWIVRELTVQWSRDELPKDERQSGKLVCIGFVTACATLLFVERSAWLYAKSIDPWLTPRHSPSLNLLWAIRGVTVPLQLLLFFSSPLFLHYSPSRKTQMVIAIAAGISFVFAVATDC